MAVEAIRSAAATTAGKTETRGFLKRVVEAIKTSGTETPATVRERVARGPVTERQTRMLGPRI